MRHRPVISFFQGLLAFTGACIAGYVFVEKRRTGDVPCMVSGYSGCADVANSSYSHIFGIDVSVLGALAYIVILLLAIVKGTADIEPYITKPRWLMAVLTAFGFCFSWWLQWVSHFILHKFCINCRLSAIIMTLLLMLSLTEAFLVYQTSERLKNTESVGSS